MKRIILFAIIALVISSAGAQLRHSSPNRKTITGKERPSMLLNHPKAQKLDLSKITSTKEMKGSKHVKPDYSNNNPQRSRGLEPFYKRPAGMYASPFHANNGAGLWSYGDIVFLMAKPFADYTFQGEVNGGVDENCHVSWDYTIRDMSYHVDDIYNFNFNSYWWIDDCPIFSADAYKYQIKAYDTQESMGGGVTVNGETPAMILSADNNETVSIIFDTENIDFMYSSKTMISGGRNADQVGILSKYYGAEPWGDNEYGWWFGKNASHVDGMAQCFEKPQHPYVLKTVYLQADQTDMVVNAPVKITCRVYKLNEIPDYQEIGSASLPVEPGELIATGEAMVTPSTGEANNGLITFTLYGHDEINPTLIYEYYPTIDFPIMICIDGYNDPGMEDLVEFSAYVSVDDQVDEGYGELAYLKQGIFENEIDPETGNTIYDEEGNPVKYFTGEYYWRGLNNYFSGGTLTLKTGLSIFIGTENPFIAFVHGLEDGEYMFPNEGGLMSKTFEYSDGSVYTSESIEFLSSYPSEYGDWWLTYEGEEELPNWLHINLQDLGTEDFGANVNASVTADPLPDGIKYREATIRFEIPGDYIEYKFMQGDESGFIENGIYYTAVTSSEAIVSYKRNHFYQGDIVIPETVVHDGIEYNVVAIGESAFKNSSVLTSVTIPVSITSIANNAFTGSSVKSICLYGEGDWNGCSLPQNINTLYLRNGINSVNGMTVNPSTIYSYSTVPPICDGQSFTEYNGTLHVPSSSVAAYFTADYWCNFAQIIGDAVEPLDVSIPQDSIDLLKGNQLQLTATVSPTNATPKTVSWMSSNNNVANVINGKITAVSVGECDVIATCVGKQDICHVTVTEIEPTTIILSQDTAVIEVNHQVTLTATVLPDSAFYNTVTWSSTDESIATVNDGVVTAKKAGTCDIIARCRDLTATCHVTVTEIEPTTIVLNQDTAVIEVNHQLTLTATVLPDSATYNTVTWSSTDESIATVNDGVVTAKKAGTCDIVAKCRDLTATCHITVVDQIVAITLDEEEIELLPNHIITLTPSATPVMPQGFTVTSSDPTVAAARVVNGKVQVVGIKEGTTTITVGSADGTAVPATCLVTVYTERGDVNMDGFINISDVTDMIDYLLGAEITDFKDGNADLDGDGKISISDVTDLIDYILSGEWPWTPQPTTPSTITFDATVDVGDGSSMASEFTVEKDGITIHVEQGVANGYHYRFYKNKKVTITSTIGDITSIVFDCIGADNDPYGSGGFTSEPGVYEPIGHQGIWTNSGVSQVVFTATNFQVRATKITVTVASNTELFAPSINPISGTYYEPVEVYMTCLTGDAKIYYTTDGSSPTVNSTLYTAPFTIPFELGNTVVKAISAKDGKISEETTVSYTFAERPPFGWANMYETPDNTEVTFTYPSIVLWQSGNTIYCKDETGYGVVYGNTGQTYLIGDIIPDGFGGRKTTYHTKPELVNPTGFQPATTYVEVYPDAITPAQVGDAFWAHYVLLEDVKIYPTSSNSGTFTDANGNSCTYFTGTFGVPVPNDGGNHDVWGIVAAYKPNNGDLEFQILPISFGTGPCHLGPARQNWQW